MTCTGPNNTQCNSCYTSYFFYNGECLLNCPIGYFGQTTIRECERCDISCQTCSGSYNYQCTSCPAGYYYNAGFCSNSTPPCSTSQFANPVNNSCTNCIAPCSTCNGPTSYNCTSCSGLYLINSTCIATCPANYYADGSAWKCQACGIGCAACNATTCLACISGYYFFSTSSPTCTLTCIAGYVADPTSLQCVNCNDTNCMNCTSKSSLSCVQCNSGYSLYNAQCVTTCLSNYFNSTTAPYSCISCNPTCTTCTGSSSTSCTSCSGNLLFYNSQCITTCPFNYIPRLDLNQCILNNCSSLCLSCSGIYFNCTSCLSGAFYYYNYCYSKCPDRTFAINSICYDCHYSCMNCVGPNHDQCESCTSPYFLLNNTNICIENCLNNTYFDTSTRSCQNCSSSCLTCMNWRTDGCTSCKDGYIVLSQNSVGACVSINIISKISSNSGFFATLNYYNQKIGMVPVYNHVSSYIIICFSTFSLILVLKTLHNYYTKTIYSSRDQIIEILKGKKALQEKLLQKGEVIIIDESAIVLRARPDSSSPREEKIENLTLQDDIADIGDVNDENNKIDDDEEYDQSPAKKSKLSLARLSKVGPLQNIRRQDSDLQANWKRQRKGMVAVEKLKMPFFYYYIYDIFHYHSLISCLQFDSFTSPGFLRAIIFLYKIITEMLMVEILTWTAYNSLIDPEIFIGKLILALIALICGHAIKYFLAGLIKIPQKRILLLISSKGHIWQKRFTIIRTTIKKNFITSAIILIVYSGFTLYSNLVYEQAVGSQIYSKWTIIMCLTNFIDLIILGFLPGLVAWIFYRLQIYTKIEMCGNIEGLINKCRAFRSLQECNLKSYKS